MNKIENYLGIANHDIQVANNSDELKSYVASILCEIDELQQENKQLKDNWNKLKEYIQKDYDFFGKLIDPKYGCAMGALSRVKDKMQELQGSEIND